MPGYYAYVDLLDDGIMLVMEHNMESDPGRDKLAALWKNQAWNLVPLVVGKHTIVANEYLRLRLTRLVLLITTRISLWPKGTIRNMELIMKRILPLRYVWLLP